MLSRKLRKVFERECRYLEYYDVHREFPFIRKRIDITLSSEVLDRFKDKINNREFSEIVEKCLVNSNLT